MARRIDRRNFLVGAGAAGAGLWMAGGAPRAARRAVRQEAAAEKLSIAGVGVGGRGWANMQAVGGENVIALCDVDRQMAASAIERFPDARFFFDYRELLEAMGDQLDAIVVSTPDHMHAPVAAAAMKRGLHVYCEKPLTWSIEEARVLATLAREKGLVTQMGNNGTAADGFRAGVEVLQAGVLGAVSEVHVWTNRPIWPQAIPTPAETPPVPDSLHWYLWLGGAPDRPYHPAYHPFAWRGWYDFGTGALGDMACHTMNLPVLGLRLDAPTRVEAKSTPLFDDSYPAGCRITYDFPARGDRGPLTFTWYDGSMSPPPGILGDREVPGSGCLVVGERGSLFSPDDNGMAHELLAKPGEVLTPPPPSLPRSPGHHAEWLAACRGEGQTLSHFGHAGPFTETVLLGNLALRVGKPIVWDSAALRATSSPEADALIRRAYRRGFSI
ncbi:MAG: Gfo/Idh/MocA family oxidoreductase [Planctomycetota bacterium]